MSSSAPKRIVLATIGSLGDLHPAIALALELKRRGHHVTLASTAHYRDKVLALGLGFTSLRPNWDPTDRDLIAQCEDLKSGPEVLFRKLILPHLRDTYDDLMAAATGADLMIAGELVYAAPLVAEKLGLRWVSAILSPISFFSAYDPSLLVNIPSVYRLRGAGWPINRAILSFGKLVSRHWWEPVRRLRRELGLRVQCDPVFKDKFSSNLALALFSSSLAQPQPDWPHSAIQPGFVFYDQQTTPSPNQIPNQITDQIKAAAALTEFLAGGGAPIVFTLGSTAVHNPGSFYATSIEAARQLGRRAVLIGVKEPYHATDVLACAYAPYSRIFPQAAVIVHQGGSGTTGQALRAGRPQLIVPYGWDQPDNGARIARLGAGLCLARSQYTEHAAAAALQRLLTDQAYATVASSVGMHVRGEDALTTACNAVEAVMNLSP